MRTIVRATDRVPFLDEVFLVEAAAAAAAPETVVAAAAAVAAQIAMAAAVAAVAQIAVAAAVVAAQIAMVVPVALEYGVFPHVSAVAAAAAIVASAVFAAAVVVTVAAAAAAFHFPSCFAINLQTFRIPSPLVCNKLKLAYDNEEMTIAGKDGARRS